MDGDGKVMEMEEVMGRDDETMTIICGDDRGWLWGVWVRLSLNQFLQGSGRHCGILTPTYFIFS